MEKLSLLTIPMCLLLAACVEDPNDAGGPGAPAPDVEPAECALGAWDLVTTTSSSGDCFLPGSWEFTHTYVVSWGSGDYTVLDEDGNQVSLEVVYVLGDVCHAEFFQEQDRLTTVMQLDADPSGQISGRGTYFGDNGCVTEFTVAGSRWY